mgnify:CR=1 FL=1
MRKTTLLLLSSVFAASAFGLPALADKGPHMFERADTDGDGFVSKQEFAATRDTMFQRIDANKDGVLSQDELQKARENWHQKMGKAAPDQSQVQPGTQAQPQPQAQAKAMPRMQAAAVSSRKPGRVMRSSMRQPGAGTGGRESESMALS